MEAHHPAGSPYRFENARTLFIAYNKLPVRGDFMPCKAPGTPPKHTGNMATVWIEKDRAVKELEMNPLTLNEFVRSLLMQESGVGPAVLDAYQCGNYNVFRIEYELLDGTMSQFLHDHDGDRALCEQELRKALQVYETACAKGFYHKDMHADNMMYKVQANQRLQWYMIDFGEVHRGGTSQPGQQTALHARLANLETNGLRLAKTQRIS